MSLAALGVSALGTGLGSLAGSALTGEPQLGFKDTKVVESVTQLNPDQLQQILDYIEGGKDTARGDISAGVASALGFLTGDTSINQRNQAINRAADSIIKAEAGQLIKNDIINSLRNTYGVNTQALAQNFDNLFTVRDGQVVLNNDENAIRDAFAVQSYGDSDSSKARYTQYLTQRLGAALDKTLQNPNVQNKLDELRVSAPARAEAQLRESSPALFANEFGSANNTFDSVAERFVDPYLRTQQGINESALRQMQLLSGLRQPESRVYGEAAPTFDQQAPNLEQAQQAYLSSPQGQSALQQLQAAMQNPGSNQLQQMQALQQQIEGGGQALYNQQLQDFNAQQAAYQDSLADYQARKQEYESKDPRLVALENTPGYQFRFEQGQRAVERQLAAQGLNKSGALLKGLTEFGQGLASQEFGAEYDRLAKMSGLTSNAGIAGSGQLQAGKFAAADLMANQGSGLAQIAQNAVQQTASSILSGGTRTSNQTNSELFNLNNLKRI